MVFLVINGYYLATAKSKKTLYLQYIKQKRLSPNYDLWSAGTTCVRFAPNSDIVQVGATDQKYRNNTVINSEHTGGIHALLADGSVHFLSDNIDFTTLKQLCVRYDGVPVGEF